MSNVEKTAWKIQASCPQGRVLTIDQALVVANVLEEAGLLAPAPHVIRTFPELEALDPETVLIPQDGHACTPRVLLLSNRIFGLLPAAVIATGAQVRAAREALGEASEN